jgi:hypothetical protein
MCVSFWSRQSWWQIAANVVKCFAKACQLFRNGTEKHTRTHTHTRNGNGHNKSLGKRTNNKTITLSTTWRSIDFIFICNNWIFPPLKVISPILFSRSLLAFMVPIFSMVSATFFSSFIFFHIHFRQRPA